VTRGGALRHPRYQRLRHPADKPAPNPAATGDTVVQLGEMTVGARTAPAGLPPAPPPRQRNYQAMGDAKLVRCLEQLHAGPGHEAYDRCVTRGSRNVTADIAMCEHLIREKGL